MSKLLVVFGATGQQGGSVINTVLSNSSLYSQYTLRALTRDTTKPAAEALQRRGVELVQGDLDDKASLRKAFKDAHTVFIVTLTDYGNKEKEVDQGKLIADTAVAAGAKYLIFSSEPPAGKLAGYPVDVFDAKAEIEAHIRGLPVASAYIAPGFFMQNISGGIAPRPSPAGDGTYTIANIMKPDTLIPLFDVAEDAGKCVGAILADPGKHEGKMFYGGERLYKMEEVAAIVGKVTGKTVHYKQLPDDVWQGFLPPAIAPALYQMMAYYRDVGYFGPEQRERVEWTKKNSTGSLTTFEEYLERNPIDLK